MTSLALPKGSSLEQRTLDLFAAAGLGLRRASSRTYRASIEYRGAIQVAFYKPREIPMVVQRGYFDFGLTGADWIEETGAKVEKVTAFSYSKIHDTPWRLVLAVPEEHKARRAYDLGDGLRVATEYPNIGRACFQALGLRAEMIPSYGATEAKIPELADAVIDVVETGTALRHNGLRVVETLRTCTPQLIANPEAFRDTDKRATIQGVARLLDAVHAGASRVLLTVRVGARHLDEVLRLMPEQSWHAGTGVPDASLVVLQGVTARDGIAETVDRLMAAGAVDVMESDVTRLVSARGSQPA
ncbi:MAG: ATP phosphoribosyltransferase [Actinocatenispora sp.]